MSSLPETYRLTLSRCVVTETVVLWDSRHSMLRASDEDPAVRAKELGASAKRLDALTPALEVVLDEFESRGLRMQKNPISNVAPYSRGIEVYAERPRYVLELSAQPRDLVQLDQLATRFAELLARVRTETDPVSHDRVLGIVAMFEERQRAAPKHLQLARWLELMRGALGDNRELSIVAGELERGTTPRWCQICGASAIQVHDAWTDRDWDATYRDETHLVCLAQPHVVTLESS